MKIHSVITFLFLFISNIVLGGFAAGTLVKTPDGSIPIEQLCEGDAVVSMAPDQSEHIVHVIQVHSYLSNDVYRVVVDSESFECDAHQKLYDSGVQEWVEVQYISFDTVLGVDGRNRSVVSIKKLSKPKIVYELSVGEPHTFLVGRSEVLAHNIAPIVAGISFAFGAGGISLEGISLAVCGIGIAAYNFFKGKKKIRVKPHVERFRAPSPAPTPDPDDEKKKKKDDSKKYKFKISEKDLHHMFRDEEGHFLRDTAANRELLLGLANNEGYFKGVCSRGTRWYARSLSNGKQLWAGVRNGSIRYGGINNVIHEFHPKSGLSRPYSPGFKR